MAKRDPNKTARNKAAKQIQEELRSMLHLVLPETGHDSELSINAYIGSKAGDFMNLKTEVIKSPEEYISKWLQGLKKAMTGSLRYRAERMHDFLKDPKNVNFRKYVEMFLRRSFLKHYDELAKVRPEDQEAHYWFGVNDAHYGLFISPRFNPEIENWENDKSEIRAFRETYWTIGHVLKTGICHPFDPSFYEFSSLKDYLNFFYGQVRLTRSTYQIEIAKRYIQFVEASDNPNKIPLLIPEIRYDGAGRKHTHRLDFLIINPYTMDKIGIEISPWSTHGALAGKHKTLKELNKEARQNWEKELKKTKRYFKKYNIMTITYTDSDLVDMDEIFKEIITYLNPEEPPIQLSLNLIEEYFLNTD